MGEPAWPADGRCPGRSGETARSEPTKRWFILPIRIDRVFVVEVMGRMAGFIAEGVGIAGGAEVTLVPERGVNVQSIADDITNAKKSGKISYIIVVAEGAFEGGATALAEDLQRASGIECRKCILGHIQRGGSPVALDRILDTKLGAYAVERALQGDTGVMVGIVNNQPVTTPIEQTWEKRKSLDDYFHNLQPILAR